MAAQTSVHASGIEQDGIAIRRRVMNGDGTQTIIPQDYEVDNKKTQAKKVAYPHSSAKTCPHFHLTHIHQAQGGFMQFLDEWEFVLAPLIFTLLAFFTRLYKIGLSPIVTWDEAQYVRSQRGMDDNC